MTDQERQLLEELANRIQKAPAPQIDPEADDLIRKGIGWRKDALYILTQTVLIQELALNQAKQQLEDLKKQQPPTSFLGNQQPQASQASGGASQVPGGVAYGQGNRAPAPPPPSGYRASSYRTDYVPPPQPVQPPPLPPQYAQPAYGAPQSGMGSFLQNAAQTAAGVVAGEVAFSAISSLFGHHGGYGGYYGGGGGGGFLGGGASFVSPVSETIINNNYYEGDRDERTFISEHESGRYGSDSDRLGLIDNSSAADVLSNDADDTLTDDTLTDDSLPDDTLDDASDDYSDDSSSYDDSSDSSDV